MADVRVPDQRVFGPLRRGMWAIVERLDRVDLRRYELCELDELRGELAPEVVRIVTDARAVVSDIMAACDAVHSTSQDVREPENGMSLAFERAMDGVAADGGASLGVIADTAFVVALELRQRHERVHLAGSAFSVIGECDSALRRIRKGFQAIDLAIARATSTPQSLPFSSETQDSLRVRSAYARFRRRLLADAAPPAPNEVGARLRSAEGELATLVGWDAYPTLRVRDRLELRGLEQQIRAWLRPDERDVEAGMRIWQDLSAFAGMLVEVNWRQELVQHDARCIAEARARLRGAAGAPAKVDQETLALLRSLEGLDDELDELLNGAFGTERVIDVLERLARQSRGAERP